MPISGSSSTTVREASPNWPAMKARRVSRASPLLEASTTPFPAARPSAFSTMGNPWAQARMAASAGSSSVKVALAAQGMPWRNMKSLAKALLPSSRAVAASWPNTGIPSRRRASAQARHQRRLGPHQHQVGPVLGAPAGDPGDVLRAGRAGRRPVRPGRRCPARRTVPPAPGPSCSFSAIACSRPPEPMIRIFMVAPPTSIHDPPDIHEPEAGLCWSHDRSTAGLPHPERSGPCPHRVRRGRLRLRHLPGHLRPLPEEGREATLHVETLLRENDLSLLGFATQEERQLYRLLVKVDGIGPKLALAALGSLPLADLLQAIRGRDVKTLCRIPGVGRKTAEKLCFELSEKLGGPGRPGRAFRPRRPGRRLGGRPALGPHQPGLPGGRGGPHRQRPQGGAAAPGRSHPPVPESPAALTGHPEQAVNNERFPARPGQPARPRLSFFAMASARPWRVSLDHSAGGLQCSVNGSGCLIPESMN